MQIYAVREVVARLRDLIASDSLLGDVWIAGECSNVSRPSSGHVYFTLKDHGAQLRSVFFANPRAKTQRLIENGAAILAHGRISLYETRGDLQIVVDYVQPEGAGALQAEFERLKAQLDDEGLFEPTRKRHPPAMPRGIGIVTSPSGAVFHDICTVLERRWPLAEVVLAPAPVQGPGAVAGIVGGLASLNQQAGVDVIIVARGGGSIEELWAFNDVNVARAIYASALPVVSAVGHETDFTIADFVADLRAPTPSAAAELVSPDRLQLEAAIRIARSSADNVIQQQVRSLGMRIAQRQHALERGIPNIAMHRQAVVDWAQRAHSVVDRSRRESVHSVGTCVWRLKSMDPYATLDRGYAIVQKKGVVVDSVSSVSTGDILDVRVKDGTFGVHAGIAIPTKRRRAGRRVPDAQATLFTMPEERA